MYFLFLESKITVLSHFEREGPFFLHMPVHRTMFGKAWYTYTVLKIVFRNLRKTRHNAADPFLKPILGNVYIYRFREKQIIVVHYPIRV